MRLPATEAAEDAAEGGEHERDVVEELIENAVKAYQKSEEQKDGDIANAAEQDVENAAEQDGNE